MSSFKTNYLKLLTKLSEDWGTSYNMTIKQGDYKLNFRVETGKVSSKYGGNNVTPQKHMNVDLYKNDKKLKNVLPNNGHKILE